LEQLQGLLKPLISSTTRVNLLIRFFANPAKRSYLRELSNEFGISSNSVREELNRLTEAQLLICNRKGRAVLYKANQEHPLFDELVSIVKKVLGIDRVVENIIGEFPGLQEAFVMDDYAMGRDTGIIDLVLVGELKQARLADLVAKTEEFINRKIRVLCLSAEDYQRLKPSLEVRPQVTLWRKDQSQKH
jgi:DNA-binding transcriptional ArsR family regulator